MADIDINKKRKRISRDLTQADLNEMIKEEAVKQALSLEFYTKLCYDTDYRQKEEVIYKESKKDFEDALKKLVKTLNKQIRIKKKKED